MPNKPGAEARAARCLPFPAGGPMRHATLRELRKSAGLTQEDLAAALDVGQDAISRLEKRSDILLSTLRHYVASLGGELTLVVSLPGQEPVIIDPLADKAAAGRGRGEPAVPPREP